MLRRIFFLLFSLVLYAYAVNFELISKNFISFEDKNSTILSKVTLEKNGITVGYVYNLKPKGYIIIPNTTLASPIKAYSFDKNYADLPKGYIDFLTDELYGYKQASEQNSLARTIDSDISKRWSFLKNFKTSNTRVLKNYIPDSYLLTSSWNQTYPYNKVFPKVGDKLTLAGCVAVAQAQLLRYYAYPSFGYGSSSYNATIYDVSRQHYFDNPSYSENLKAVFHRPFNWNIMPSSLDNAKDYQIDEVSYLLRDLAILNKAKIGLDQTYAFINMAGFVENLGYSDTMKVISTENTTKTLFLDTLKSQIDLKQPVLLSFPTHMTVADGYRSDSSGNYIHINMGWGGAGNDFYNLDASSISASDTQLSSASLDMIYDIKPCSISQGDCFQNLESGDTATNTGMIGSFKNVNDEDKYNFYLSGTTTVSITQGWFFVNIYDSKGNLSSVISPNTTPYSETINLPTDLYTVVISLSNHSSSQYFSLESGNKEYAVDLSTQDINQSTKEAIDISIHKPVVFDMNLKDIALGTEEKKIRVNAYSEDSNLTFKALTNDNIKATFNRNILTLEANRFNTLNNLTIEVSSPSETISKNTKVLTYPTEIKFGKSFNIGGVFDSQTDYDEYSVVLDGTCNIYGMNGYSNQAFYTTLVGFRDMSNSTISTPSLTRDFYTIGASLSENPQTGYGGFYTYTENSTHNNYILHAECPDASENIEDIIPLLENDISKDDDTTSTYTQHIDQDWSLVTIPTDVNLTQDEIKTKFANSKIIWTYKDGNWSVLGLDDSTRSLLENSEIAPISNLHVNDGFWVYTPNGAYDINYSDNLTTHTLNIEPGSERWMLLGSSTELNSSDILQNNNIKSIWVYRDGNWFAKSSDADIQSLYNENNIAEVTNIKRGEGFWLQRD